MKCLFLNFLLLFSSPGFGQTLPDSLTKIKLTSTFSATPGKTYVDSIEMDMSKTYPDPDNIREIKSFKGKDAKLFSGAKAAILISRKKQEPFVSLSDIRLSAINSIDRTLPTIFVIDGILMDTIAVRLETTAIKTIDIIKPSVNPEMLNDTKKNVILITTKGKNRKKNGY
jgi:hypothetical protein